MDKRQPARFVLRIERSASASASVRRDRGADFDADGIGDAAEILHVRAVQRARPFADPRKVGREVVPAGAMGHLPGLGLFIEANAGPRGS